MLSEETKDTKAQEAEVDKKTEKLESNPFVPNIIPIDATKLEHASDRAYAQTPSFIDNVQIPAVSSGTESKEGTSSPDRSKSPFMRVKLMPMVDPDSLKDLNKSGISSNGRSLSNNGRRKEWKATQFKSISISKVNTQANN